MGRLLLNQSGLLVCWALVLSLYDVLLCASRGSDGAIKLTVFAGFAVAAVLSVVWPLGLARALLQHWAGGSVLRRLAVGALDGLMLAYLVSVRATYASVTPEQMRMVSGVLVLATSICCALAPRVVPALRFSASAILLLTAFAVEALLPFRENAQVHLALDLIALAAFVALASEAAERVPKSVHVTLTIGGLIAVLFAPLLLQRSMATRALLYDLSSHARIHAEHTGRWLAIKRIKRGRPGVVRCPQGERSVCEASTPPQVTSLDGSAKRADILMLTLDAVRWDREPAFAGLLAELGAHVSFSRAVSPSTRTNQSFTAMLRGRPLRQVRGRRIPSAAPGLKLPSTIAAELTGHGFRALTVATHKVLRPSEELAAGFEYVQPRGDYPKPRGEASRVPFGVAAASMLSAVRDTTRPVLAWLHALETHVPYTSDTSVGPPNEVGQLEAARDLDKKLVEFVRAFRALRPERKLIIVVFGDHGEEFGEHGGSAHSSTVFAEQSRVMFALSAPSLTSRRVAAPVSTTAIPATLFALLGLPVPCTFTVPSLLACIEREDACPELAVTELAPFKSRRRSLVAYTSAQHRLLIDRTSNVARVFDSLNDPTEQTDLADSQPALLRKLTQQATAWDLRYCVAHKPLRGD